MGEKQLNTQGNDESYLRHLKEAIEREREKETAGLPNARALLEDELSRYERDKTDPIIELTAGNLAAIFGISKATVIKLIEAGHLNPEGKEITYRIRKSEIDHRKAELSYHRGRRFIIAEENHHPDFENFTLPDEIAKHIKERITGEGFVAYELNRALTPEEAASFIQQRIRVLPSAAFNDYQTYRK